MDRATDVRKTAQVDVDRFRATDAVTQLAAAADDFRTRLAHPPATRYVVEANGADAWSPCSWAPVAGRSCPRGSPTGVT